MALVASGQCIFVRVHSLVAYTNAFIHKTSLIMLCFALHFSRDRGSSYSSGHASDSSVNDSPRPRQSRVKELRRSKSVSTRSDAASSSGYESMRNDTSHASSDSCSDRDSSKKRKKKGKYQSSYARYLLIWDRGPTVFGQ